MARLCERDGAVVPRASATGVATHSRPTISDRSEPRCIVDARIGRGVESYTVQCVFHACRRSAYTTSASSPYYTCRDSFSYGKIDSESRKPLRLSGCHGRRHIARAVFQMKFSTVYVRFFPLIPLILSRARN